MQQLDTLWREQGLGGPVCFSWIDWLQNDALPFLGITERLLLTFTPHDPASAQSFPEGPAAEAPRLLLPAQPMQPGGSALTAANMDQGERQANQRLVGSAKASQASDGSLQNNAMNGMSHQAPHRQQKKHQHSRDSGSLTEEQALWRDCQGRQRADDCAAGRSSNLQLDMCERRSRSQSSHGASLNPNAHAWQPRGMQSCRQPEPQAASEQGQGPGCLQAEQSHERAAVLEEPVSAPGTQRDDSESVRAGSRATSPEQLLDSLSDMEQIAKLYTRLATYSKMRDRELFKEVRPFYCLYESHNWHACSKEMSPKAPVSLTSELWTVSIQTLADGPFSATQ